MNGSLTSEAVRLRTAIAFSFGMTTLAAAEGFLRSKADLLLDEQIDRAFDTLAEAHRGDPDRAAMIEHRRALVARCKSEGIDAVFTDLLNQQAYLLARELALVQSEPFGADRVERCRNALSWLDPRLQADSWADWRHELGVALAESREGDVAVNIEEAIASYEDVLGIHTRDANPGAWANVQNSLGIAYLKRVHGDQRANLEMAAQHLSQALEVHTKEAAPRDWMGTQVNLGNVYRRGAALRHSDYGRSIEHYERGLEAADAAGSWLAALAHEGLGEVYFRRSRGDSGPDLEAAIDHYRQALATLTPEDPPEVAAQAQRNLGEALLRSTEGNQAKRAVERVEEAIVHLRQSTSVESRESSPGHWSLTQHNLGIAYMARTQGSRAENLERAIGHCLRALRVRTRKDDPLGWAETQHNLANAFGERVCGDPAENVERAIAILTDALTVFSRRAHSTQWAMVQHALGIEYAERLDGDAAQNGEEAIRHYRQALEVYTRRAAPTQWAMTQHNMGNCFAQREGQRRADDFEQAIHHYGQALSVFTRRKHPTQWGRTNGTLANVYVERIRGDRSENIEAAIRHYRNALEIFTETNNPLAWAENNSNLATAYESRTKGRRHDNVRKAIEHYRLGLRVRTPELLPAEAITTLRSLGMLLFEEERWTEAEGHFALAIDAGEELLSASYTVAGRKAQVGKTSTLYSLAAYCAIRLDRPEEALARLERGKARMLAEALVSRDVVDAITLDQRKELSEARERVGFLGRRMRMPADVPGTRASDTGAALRDAVDSLRRLMTRIRSEHPELSPATFDIPSLLELIPSEGALVATLITHRQSAAFVIPGDARAVSADHVVWLDGLNADALLAGTEEEPGWLYLYLSLTGRSTDGVAGWEETVESYTARLWNALIGPIHDRLMSFGLLPGAPVVFIPQGNLGALPIGAAWREINGLVRTFLDDFTLSYQPSAYSLSVARRRLVEREHQPASLVAVVDPTVDLPFTRVEASQVAASCLQAAVVLEGPEATPDAVLRTAHHKTHLHFACHGFYNWNDPMASSLILAAGTPLPLARIISDLDLEEARLVVLSACETGLVDFRGAYDEYVGLAAGIMMAGSPGVLVSLWQVDDVSTALLMGRFYRLHLGKGIEPAGALREAQLWLRTATTRELGLADLYRRQWEESEEKDEEVTYREWRYHTKRLNETPFTHPYHWAGFILAGA